MTDLRALAAIPDVQLSAPELGYRTALGAMYQGSVEDFLSSPSPTTYAGPCSTIFTSPPFPLNRKKRYGNKQGDEYLKWLSSFASPLAELLADDGSLVVELGNAWEPGEPVMSTLALEALLQIKKSADLELCQQFVCHNPARLPSPAQWVNIESDMSPNDPYVVVDSASADALVLVVNLRHPNVQELRGAEGVANYLRHCVYDALAEWKARQRTATPDPDTIKLLKDGYLRVSMQLEMHSSQTS